MQLSHETLNKKFPGNAIDGSLRNSESHRHLSIKSKMKFLIKQEADPTRPSTCFWDNWSQTSAIFGFDVGWKAILCNFVLRLNCSVIYETYCLMNPTLELLLFLMKSVWLRCWIIVFHKLLICWFPLFFVLENWLKISGEKAESAFINEP